MSDITLYHNPACGTSRTVLAMIRDAGVEPVIIEYLKTPPERATLEQLIADMGIAPRELLRQKEAAFESLGLSDPALSDAQLIDAMVQEPVLMNRPIVVSPRGTRLCRPADTAAELLPPAQPGATA